MSDPLIVIEDNTNYYVFEYAITVVVLLFLLYYFFRSQRNTEKVVIYEKRKVGKEDNVTQPEPEKENNYPLRQGMYGETITYFFDSSDDPYASQWREIDGGLYIRDSDKWADVVNKPVEEEQWEKSALKNIVYYEDTDKVAKKVYDGLTLHDLEGYTNNPTNDHH